MKYVYIDGDDIGLKIEKSFMSNDESTLRAINNAVNIAIVQLTNYLAVQDCEIIFSGADAVIFKTKSLNVVEIYSHINAMKPSMTFSMGVGNSLREAFLALRYAKANGKNGVAIHDDDLVWIGNPERNNRTQPINQSGD